MKILGLAVLTLMATGTALAKAPCSLETPGKTKLLWPIESAPTKKIKNEVSIAQSLNEQCHQKLQQYLTGKTKEEMECSQVIFEGEEGNVGKYVIYLTGTHDSTWDETCSDKCQKIQECLKNNQGERQDLEDLGRTLECFSSKRSSI